jgi:hypothetical protein
MEGTNDKTSQYLLVKSGRYNSFFCFTAVFCHISIVTNHFRLVSYHYRLVFCHTGGGLVQILNVANHFCIVAVHFLMVAVHFRYVTNHF